MYFGLEKEEFAIQCIKDAIETYQESNSKQEIIAGVKLPIAYGLKDAILNMLSRFEEQIRDEYR